MAHWAKEILGNSLAASWAQAAAAIILVVITAWYVRVTRGMATAARDQADRTAAGWDRSYEDGLKQQQQLVKRQAVDKARAELSARMSTSLQCFRDAHSTLDSVYDAYDETAVFAEVATLKERGLRGQYVERFGRVSEEARADLDLKYLARLSQRLSSVRRARDPFRSGRLQPRHGLELGAAARNASDGSQRGTWRQ